MTIFGEHPTRELLREKAFIGGRWVLPSKGNCVAVDDPATLNHIGQVPDLNADYIESAIDAADAAFRRWRLLPSLDRADKLLAWHAGMLEQREGLARLMTLEQGKPLEEARGEVDYAASFLRWFAEECRHGRGSQIPAEDPETTLGTFKQAVGVVAVITPWNFPLAMITRKAAAALAAGCTVLVRPANETPFSALALAALAQDAGLDSGEFNVLTTRGQRFAQVVGKDPRVRALSFTGSTEVGRKLLETAAATIKRTSMELGGNAPFIVCEDADLDSAVDIAVNAKFQTSGQDCIAANRFYVHENLYESFIERFSARMDAMVVGNGFDEATEIGPLISEAAVKKSERLVADAGEKGARIIGRPQSEAPGKRFFMPSLIADFTSDMQIATEESFAPIAPVAPFRSDKEAIAAANATEFGLAAYVCSHDDRRLRKYLRELEYGMIGANTMDITGPHVPFGGVKQSGLGREGGHMGMDEYLETKYYCLGERPTPPSDPNLRS